MKKALLILVMAVASAFTASAQIQNFGFEEWNGSVPTDWVLVSGRSGKVEVLTITTNGGKDTLRKPVYDGQFAVLLQGDPNAGTPGILAQKFPISNTPTFLGGTYAFFPAGNPAGEHAGMRVIIWNSTTHDTNLNVIVQLSADQINPWGAFNANLSGDYNQGAGTPDSGLIFIYPTLGVGNQFNPLTTLVLGSIQLTNNQVVSVREVENLKTSMSAYPNPTRGNATINFTLSNAANVSLAVYDLNGREVMRLAEGSFNAGAHQANFDGAGLEKGMYIYRLKAGDVVETGKLILSE